MPFKIKESKDKKFYTVLTARNGEVLSTSEMMEKHSAVLKNIKAQCKNLHSTGDVKVFDEVMGKKFVMREGVIVKYTIKDYRK